MEIKFEKGDVIYRFVYHAVKKVLEKSNLIPEAKLSLQNTLTPSYVESTPKYSFDPSSQTVLVNTPLLVASEQELQTNYIEESSKFPRMKLLGQIHKTFFVAETSGGLLIIDQHIVQERVLYERFMKQYMDNSINVQNLLEPAVLEFSAQDAIVVVENLDNFSKLGFGIEEFGGSSFLVRSIPMIFGRAQPKELILDLINQFGSRTSIEKKIEDVITRMSCRYSIKAGDNVTLPHFQSLLKELNSCELAYHCPHGRPIFVKVSADELEKMFMRK